MPTFVACCLFPQDREQALAVRSRFAHARTYKRFLVPMTIFERYVFSVLFYADIKAAAVACSLYELVLYR